MNKIAVGKRVMLGLAVAASIAAPVMASAHDGWGRDDGHHQGWDRDGWRHDRGEWRGDDRREWRGDDRHHGGHWSGGKWIAGALVAGAVVGLVSEAMAPPPPAPVYYQQAPTVVYRQPTTVVYQQPGTVVYEDAPVRQTVVYGQPYGAQYGDDDGQ